MSIKIISKDLQETQTIVGGWSDRSPDICYMTNPDNVSFSIHNTHHPVSSRLVLSQNFYSTPVGLIPKYKHVLIFNIPFTGNFCHNIIDLLPELLWLDQQPEYDLIVIPVSEETTKFVNQFKIKFNNVKFIEDDFDIRAEIISWYMYSIQNRKSEKILNLRSVFMRQLSSNNNCNKMIYCTRNSGEGAIHKRVMTHTNHREIINMSRQFASDNKLNFVIFDGRNQDGTNMSLFDQAQLFCQAKIIFGPHGGAFANIIHVPAENQCRVCEFTSGVHSAVQHVSHFNKNYNKLLANAPETYLDYFLIPFTEESNKDRTSIDIESYQEFLKICI